MGELPISGMLKAVNLYGVLAAGLSFVVLRNESLKNPTFLAYTVTIFS